MPKNKKMPITPEPVLVEERGIQNPDGDIIWIGPDDPYRSKTYRQIGTEAGQGALQDDYRDVLRKAGVDPSPKLRLRFYARQVITKYSAPANVTGHYHVAVEDQSV